MIVVAIAAIVFGYFASSLRMWYLASYHRAERYRVYRTSISHHRLYVQRLWHAEMEERCRRAIWFPWSFEPAPLPP